MHAKGTHVTPLVDSNLDVVSNLEILVLDRFFPSIKILFFIFSMHDLFLLRGCKSVVN